MDIEKVAGGGAIQNISDVLIREMNVKSGEDVVPVVDSVPQEVESFENFDQVLEKFKAKLEKLRRIFNTEAEFSIDKDTNMVIVKIKDKDTGEVIRQIPPEVVLKIAKTIDEFLGLLFDERV